MQSRTPPLFATGRWVIDDPFSVPSGAVYTCKAIRSFDDIRLMGIDPFEQYYVPKGVDEETFEQDEKNLANIVTLMSDNYPTVYVPDTFIISYPDTTTVPYRHVVLSLSLGAIPDHLALEDFKDKVEQSAEASLGIETTVREHQAGSLSEGIDQQSHRTLENNRLARITGNQTEYAKLLNLKEEATQLREYVGILEKLAIDNGLIN